MSDKILNTKNMNNNEIIKSLESQIEYYKTMIIKAQGAIEVLSQINSDKETE